MTPAGAMPAPHPTRRSDPRNSEVPTMANTQKLIFLVLGLAALVACGKKEEAKVAAAPVVVSVPADPNDSQAWKLYLVSVAKQNMEGIRSSPYMYYLPAGATPAQAAAAPEAGSTDRPPSVASTDAAPGDEDQEYNRQLDNVTGVVGRGVLPGNMLAFGSPDSARMANLVVDAFTGIPAGSMKDVRVLFVGAAADSDRVKAVVEPSGANCVFHEAK
jgi:hypothetical protein